MSQSAMKPRDVGQYLAALFLGETVLHPEGEEAPLLGALDYCTVRLDDRHGQSLHGHVVVELGLGDDPRDPFL